MALRWLEGLTNAAGEGDKVDEPEEHPLALQLDSIEHNAGEHQGRQERQHQLLQHLGHEVRDHPVEPIIPLPAQSVIARQSVTTHRSQSK